MIDVEEGEVKRREGDHVVCACITKGHFITDGSDANSLGHLALHARKEVHSTRVDESGECAEEGAPQRRWRGKKMAANVGGVSGVQMPRRSRSSCLSAHCAGSLGLP